MTNRETLTAVTGILLVLMSSPVAWGCDSMEAASCQLSACPMSSAISGAENAVPPCHSGSEGTQDRGSLAPAASACCQAPVDREPIDSASNGQIDLSSSLLLAEVDVVAVQEKVQKPLDSAATVASQRHELGRYKLLSAYLI